RPLNVKRDLQRPAAVRAGVGGTAGLVHLGEAAVGRCTGGQTEPRTEDAEITLGRRVIKRIEPANRLTGTRGAVGGETVDGLDGCWAESSRRAGGIGMGQVEVGVREWPSGGLGYGADDPSEERSQREGRSGQRR